MESTESRLNTVYWRLAKWMSWISERKAEQYSYCASLLSLVDMTRLNDKRVILFHNMRLDASRRNHHVSSEPRGTDKTAPWLLTHYVV